MGNVHSKTTAFISLGSNLGDRAGAISRAIAMLGDSQGVSVSAASSVLETKPLDGMEQADYLNAVAKIETELPAEGLFAAMQRIENDLGRRRDRKWGPRNIDLDLILYGDRIIRLADLTVPHSQMHVRSFVLKPMCELAADRVHPVIGRTMQELLGRLNGRDYVLSPARPQLVSVAGVIGVGKTTLARGIAEILACPLVAEAYDENPYLADVYSGREDLALKSQLFFLDSRVRQIGHGRLKLAHPAVSDYVFDKEMIYAAQTLDTKQMAIYTAQHKRLAQDVWNPVVTVYLHDRPEACLRRIASRNRPYERRITLDELRELKAAYDALFANWTKSPLIRLDASRFDCTDTNQVKALTEELGNYLWK